jgi:glycyl-tRNA synthetase
MATNDILLDKITALSKRRGFIYPSSEIYGGLANSYDFGPYGTALKENLKRLWWQKFILMREDIFGVDTSTIINPKVWESSGHVENFADVMVEDIVNHRRHRADHLIEEHFEKKGEPIKVDGLPIEKIQELIDTENIISPDGNKLSPARKFSTLFETGVGIISGEKNTVYLRGEIAQGLFINFKNILNSLSPKLPFGIGQAGKVFRNEITKGQFTFRTLEFDLMEFEYFFDPEINNWEKLFEYWQSEIYDFAISVGLNSENLRWRPHEEFELSHYSSRTEDLEYKFPWGYREMFACAYRSDFDLRNHQEKSGKNLEYVYPDGKKLIPHVIEPTFGLSRLVTILLVDSYHEEEVNGKTRVVMKLNPEVAPVKAAIFPLQKDEKLQNFAKDIFKNLKNNKISVEYEDKGNIGKMYRRHDEIGTPACITIDYQSLEDNTVTIRDRDTMEQRRVDVNNLQSEIAV